MSDLERFLVTLASALSIIYTTLKLREMRLESKEEKEETDSEEE